MPNTLAFDIIPPLNMLDTFYTRYEKNDSMKFVLGMKPIA